MAVAWRFYTASFFCDPLLLLGLHLGASNKILLEGWLHSCYDQARMEESRATDAKRIDLAERNSSAKKSWERKLMEHATEPLLTLVTDTKFKRSFSAFWSFCVRLDCDKYVVFPRVLAQTAPEQHWCIRHQHISIRSSLFYF